VEGGTVATAGTTGVVVVPVLKMAGIDDGERIATATSPAVRRQQRTRRVRVSIIDAMRKRYDEGSGRFFPVFCRFPGLWQNFPLKNISKDIYRNAQIFSFT
jgi:hypothetical protein